MKDVGGSADDIVALDAIQLNIFISLRVVAAVVNRGFLCAVARKRIPANAAFCIPVSDDVLI